VATGRIGEVRFPAGLDIIFSLHSHQLRGPVTLVHWLMTDRYEGPNLFYGFSLLISAHFILLHGSVESDHLPRYIKNSIHMVCSELLNNG
jgi:hypothetical protein